jgi:mRNA degradation ribonuclease J1/J2
MKRPPSDLDVLVCEGTNLGTDKPVMSEQALEDDFVALFERTAGRIFAAWSGQNVNRTVTSAPAHSSGGQPRLWATGLFRSHSSSA